MTHPEFMVGDHVRWNSEASRLIGRIVDVHTQGIEYERHKRRASPDGLRYEVERDKTDHAAGSALSRIK